MEKAITFCLCGWNCFWLSLMPRLPVASFVIDRMSDGSIHFCGDVLTIKEHWYIKEKHFFLFKNTGDSTQQLEIKMQIIHISSFHERSNLENKTKDKLLSMVFIDPIYFMNSLFNFASFHSTFQPKVVEILIELINKSYHDQNLPVVRNVKVFF